MLHYEARLPIPKTERLSEIIRRLVDAAPFRDGDVARSALEEIMRSVENAWSGVPEDPMAAISPDPTDGRMYPPHDDFERSSGSPFVRLWRHRRHKTYIGSNGALQIERASGFIEVDIPGCDGKCVCELLEKKE